tara:strand:+ start:277 stop:492 length:216 start_codon:yes stop_codon:yes gene_type:complete
MEGINMSTAINTTPTIRAKELVIGNTMDLIRELEDDLGPTNSQFDGKVIKQLKKLVNRMARDIGADEQYTL